MSTSVSCTPLLALVRTTCTPSVFQSDTNVIQPHMMLRPTTRCASTSERGVSAQRQSSRFAPRRVSLSSVSAVMCCRSVGTAARGKPATLERPMPGNVQHLRQCCRWCRSGWPSSCKTRRHGGRNVRRRLQRSTSTSGNRVRCSRQSWGQFVPSNCASRSVSWCIAAR